MTSEETRVTCRRRIMKRLWDGDLVLIGSTQNGKGKWSLTCWKQASFCSLVSIAPVSVSVLGTGRLNWASEKTLAEYINKCSDPTKKIREMGQDLCPIPSNLIITRTCEAEESVASRRKSENYFCSCVSVSHVAQKGRLSAWLDFIQHTFIVLI